MHRVVGLSRKGVPSLAALGLLATFAGAGALAQGLPDSFLQMKDCPDVPGCPAIILLDETELSNDAKNTLYRWRQIRKIFTEEGIQDFSDMTLSGWGRDLLLVDVSGRTILPDGTVISLGRENVTEKSIKRGKVTQRVRSANFPGLVPGAILDISASWRTELHSFWLSDVWYIQHFLPVLKTTYTLFPGNYRLGWWKGGSEEVNLDIVAPTKNSTVFTARNVPPVPDEPFGPNPAALQARLYFEMPELQEAWLGTLAGRISGRAGRFLEENAGIAEKLAELLSPTDSRTVKAGKIYQFVQERIGTEEERAKQVEEAKLEPAKSAADILSRGYGNEFERTMLFLALAKEAGVESALLLIVSRYNGLLDMSVPDSDQFDSYAAAVKLGSGWTFYDPATKHCPVGMLSPEKEMGAPNAILITPDKEAGAEYVGKIQKLQIQTNQPSPFTLVDVPFSPSSKNVLTREAKVKVLPDGSAEIDMTEYGTGLVELGHKRTFGDLDEEKRRETLTEEIRREIPGAELIEATFEKVSGFEKGARIQCKLRVPEVATLAGDRLILIPSVFHSAGRNPFAEEARKTPVHFPYARRIVERIEFELPEGYASGELPGPVSLTDAPLEFKTLLQTTGNGLKLTRQLNVDTATWTAGDYARLRTFFEKIHATDTQAVILGKIPG